MNEVDYEARCIVRAFADAMEAAIKKDFDMEDFIEKTLQTKAFSGFMTNYTLYSQSGLYIVDYIKGELKQNGIPLKKASEYQTSYKDTYKEIAYWIGYIFMYWRFAENVPLSDLQKCDIERMTVGYPALHTQSPEYAIEAIKNYYIVKEEERPL